MVVTELVTRLQRTPERMLHGWRRRRVLKMLGRRPRPATLLVVCHGNRCRSPFAAAVLARALPGLRVESAGFVGFNRPVPHDALAAAARLGVDLSAHRSQVVTPGLVRAADLIVVMDAAQRQALRERFGQPSQDVLILGDLDPWPVQSRAIPDPVVQSSELCESVYRRIERCVVALTAALERRPAGPKE
jgi:protein-tyrosine phosphatase